MDSQQGAVSEPAVRRARIAFGLFDFANSAFNTVVVTFVYSAFFARVLVGDAERGDVLWAQSQTLAGVLLALIAPVLGVLADRTAHKRRYFLVLSGLTILCTALLYLPAPGPNGTPATPEHLILAFVLVTVANIAFESAFAFYNSFLPTLGDATVVGRLSGYSFALGYLGGLLSLALCLPLAMAGDADAIRSTNLIVAGWFLLFGMPAFLWLRDGSCGKAASTSVLHGLRQVGRTLCELPRRPQLLRLLVAHLLYNDALLAVIALASLYMAGTLEMTSTQIIYTAIGLNVVAGISAMVFGRIDHRIGSKTALIVSLLMLMTGTTLAIAWPTVPAFLVAAALIGMGMGPNQSSSRSMMARLTPRGREGEFFGLFALSGKATAWIGFLLYWLVRDSQVSQRGALVPLVILFGLGLLLVLGLDPDRGDSEVAGTIPDREPGPDSST